MQSDLSPAGRGEDGAPASCIPHGYAASMAADPEGRAVMPETDKAFTGSIPENYDRYLVPLIFDGFARDLARRVAALSPLRVLETAAGSGVVTRALAATLSPQA